MPSVVDEHVDPVLTRDQLIKDQQVDPELSVIAQHALSEKEAANHPVCYFLKADVLMRKWRPPDVPATADWKVTYQIVVPQNSRETILKLALSTPMAGHLGVNKTCNRILSHFYWPGVRKDVVKFCKLCHTCQLVGKPNQKIPVAPLKPIPAFSEPFSRVIVDCVGPLPKTKAGYQYLLTIMCTSTRFPEAVPLRNIKAKTIIRALVKFFSFVGLPRYIQSDQGSNFMSGLFQQVMYHLGIEQVKSSAYHPESQGALERFHQTLKNMLRTYCVDTEKEWDEGVHLVLFAAREAVQDSLGFSPFELIFGRTVRGPLKLVKEAWLGEDTTVNLLDHMSNLQDKLSTAAKLAQTNLKSAQKKMKQWYDKRARQRSFKPGEKVLVLLPIPGNTLQARYSGPYCVEEKLSDVNYVIRTTDRRQQRRLCHINMLKQYYDPQESQSGTKAVVTVKSVQKSQTPSSSGRREEDISQCEP